MSAQAVPGQRRVGQVGLTLCFFRRIDLRRLSFTGCCVHMQDAVLPPRMTAVRQPGRA